MSSFQLLTGTIEAVQLHQNIELRGAPAAPGDWLVILPDQTLMTIEETAFKLLFREAGRKAAMPRAVKTEEPKKAPVKRAGAKPPAGARQAKPDGKEPPPVGEFIIRTVRAMPCTNSELVEFAQRAGIETDSQKMSAMLFYLRKQNKVLKSDRDLKWRLAEKA